MGDGPVGSVDLIGFHVEFQEAQDGGMSFEISCLDKVEDDVGQFGVGEGIFKVIDQNVGIDINRRRSTKKFSEGI